MTILLFYFNLGFHLLVFFYQILCFPQRDKCLHCVGLVYIYASVKLVMRNILTCNNSLHHQAHLCLPEYLCRYLASRLLHSLYLPPSL